ncbi:tubulin-specific chaperone E-like [Littorina saxatilis]
MAADDAELTRKDGSKVEIGDRISVDDNIGTVRFIGCVPPTKGVWLGVEWDDPSRGKHDGSHEGVRYFETSHPTSGSFVRPKKVDLGQDLVSAIQHRYGVQHDGDAGVDTDKLFVLDSSNRATVVEMVGAEKVNKKQSQLDRLKEVSVREKNVYGIRPDCKLAQITPKIVELDLSRNLVASWDMVARICQHLPHLNNLHLSENCLPSPADPQKLAPVFTKVTILYLNKMNYTWEQVMQCCCMFPALEKLYVCNNVIETLQEPKECLQCLKVISLESNLISSWEEMLKLGGLQRLETLVISDNKIERMYFPDVSNGQKSNLFPSLKQIFFTGKNVKEWSTFDELNKLRSLVELQFGSIPSLGEPELVREIVIAKIANLKRCNRTVVEEQERKGAEIDYLKRYGPEWLKSGGSQDPTKNKPKTDFLSQHPSFQAIVEKWGAPEDSEMTQQSKSLKDNLIIVKMVCPACPEKTVVEKKLPVTMSIQKIRTMVKRMFKLDGDFFLYYTSQKMQGPEIEFDNELRQLSFYSVESGDTIHVKCCTA